MADWVAKETVAAISGYFQNPCERRIGPRPCFQDWIVIGYACGESVVELEDGLRRLPFLPVALCKTQGIHVKTRPSTNTVEFSFSKLR